MNKDNFPFLRACKPLYAPEAHPETPLQTIDVRTGATRTVPLNLVTKPNGSDGHWQLALWDLELGGDNPPFLCDPNLGYFIALETGVLAEAGAIITRDCSHCMVADVCLPQARMNATHAGILVNLLQEDKTPSEQLKKAEA